MNFLLRTPFFRLLLALIAGITTSRYLVIFNLTLLTLMVLAIVFIVWSLMLRKGNIAYRFRWVFGAGVLILVFLGGYYLADIQSSKLPTDFPDKPATYTLHLYKTPEVKERSVLCPAKLVVPESLSGQWSEVPKVMVYLQKDSAALQLNSGDILLAYVQFSIPVASGIPETFDYAALLRRKGISATAYADSLHWRKIASKGDRSVRYFAERSRDKLLDVFRRLPLKKEEFAVLAALTLGYKEELEPDLMAHYSASGAMHILSVSGLHVGVIYLIVNALLSILFRSADTLVYKTIGLLLLLWAYAFITGLSPSVVRASAMFSMVAVGKALERRAQIYNTISTTGFILLIANPAYLSDVGFQLSYSAVAGIVYFQPKIASLLIVRNKALKWFWDLTSVSLAAQIGTLPLSLYYFNQFPNYFLLTNYIAIPLSTFIIYVAVSFLAVSPLAFVAQWVGWVLAKLLLVLNVAVEWIHALPGSVAHVYTGGLELFLLIMVMVCFIGYAGLKKYLFIPAAMIFLLIIQVEEIYSVYMWQNTQGILISCDRKALHLQLISGRNEWALTSDSTSYFRQFGKFRLKHKLRNRNFTLLNKSNYLFFNGKRIVVISDERYRKKKSVARLKTDYLVVHQFKRQRVDDFMALFDPGLCIVGTGVSEYYAGQLEDWCRANGVRFYSISRSGAYVELTQPNG